MAGVVVMLPVLRSELSLHPGPTETNGAPTWILRDPVRNRFFRISWPAFELLSRWQLGSADRIADAVNRETTLCPNEEDVVGLAEFLFSNQLVRPHGAEDRHKLATRAKAEKPSWHHWLLHRYLFFRIPLVRPDKVLNKAMPAVLWMGSGWFRFCSLIALVFGLLLVSRQWDLFVTTLIDTFSWHGLFNYVIALIVVKIIHELAHAFTAKHFGCRVPTIGVAFIVLWPMLYTDVNDSWMLPERRKRLFVGSAGILAELTVAAWATLAWSFLPEGPFKQAAFVLATLTWISSLVINTSPFMRFDGYFVMMDALEMPNLHPRAFAMARWWIREVLFDLRAFPPEPVSRSKRLALVAFAFVVWVYRLVVFLTIAVLVYHFFIKVVGVLLFVVEIWWFIARPIWSELRLWGKMRKAIFARKRIVWVLAFAIIPVLLAFIPWQSTISAPAVMKGQEKAELFLPFPAQLASLRVSHGQKLKAGDVLMTFEAPHIEDRKAVAEAAISGRKAELEAATLDPRRRENTGVAREHLGRAKAERAALEAETGRLALVAPMDGTVFDLLPDLNPGDWLSPRQKLGLVRTDAAAVAIAYVNEDDLARIREGAEAEFIPYDHGKPRRTGRVLSIATSPTKVLGDEMLASVYGGSIPSRISENQVLPEGAHMRVTIQLDAPPPNNEIIGKAYIGGERSSLTNRLFRSIMVVLVREWGT